jgi:hypothetical protein
MPSIINVSTTSKKPCEKGMMRTKVVQYRCVNNKTFHDNFVNKLNNARPRSSRRSSSLNWHTPKSKSKSRSPVMKKLRKTSPTSPRRALKPSLANAIRSMGMNKLRKTVTSPRRALNPSLANAIRSINMNTLRKTVTSPRRKMIPSLANAIRSMGMNKLRKISPNKRLPKPSFLNAIKGMNRQKLKHVSPNKRLPKQEEILPTINNKYNEIRSKLALRRKTLKESSGSGDWS